MADEKYRSGGGSDPLSKRILNSIKPFSGEQTSKWLAALSTDAVKDAVVIKDDADPTQEPPRSMAAWVDGLFDHFQRYAYDFSGMCSDPELQVNCTRPALQEPKGPATPGGAPDTSVVSLGYLSTYQWALVVRGEFFRIQIYIVPVGVLMGFKARHEEFPLYMEMIAAQTARNKINWTLDGKPVSMDQASAIAKRLFAHLVMVARGEASDKDKFSLSQKPPTAAAPDSSMPARPSSFGTSDSKVELLKPEWLLDENPTRPTHSPPVRPSYAPINHQLPQSLKQNQAQPQASPLPQQEFPQQLPQSGYAQSPPAQPGAGGKYQSPQNAQLPPHLQPQSGQSQQPLQPQSQQQQSSTGPNGRVMPTHTQQQQSATGPQGYLPVQPQQQQQTSTGPQGYPPQHSQQQQTSTGPHGYPPQHSQQQQTSTGPQGYPPQHSQQQQTSTGPQGYPPQHSQQQQSSTGPQGYLPLQPSQYPQPAAQQLGAPTGYPPPQISAVTAPASTPLTQNQNANQQVRGNMQELLQQNLVLVLNECNQFSGALDQQLELLTSVGVKSIQNQDMDTASDVMQRAKKLKALLDAVVTFTNEWKTNSK